MKLAIIKYNAGNVQSVSFALERLGVDFILTDNAEEIHRADKVLFPGVGEASTTMKYLRETKLDALIKSLTQPVLGICLGMQLLCKHSDENNTDCLGIFDENVKRFVPQDGLKVPHMGWNKIHTRDSWLDPQVDGKYIYFVHSYYVPVNEFTSAITEYIKPFSAAIIFMACSFTRRNRRKPENLFLKVF
jgi:imidazole glycerol-phosphate synthase subunit HisH